MKSKRTSVIIAVIAIVLVFAMLLTSTFAWQSISQQALNQTVVLPPQAGGRLHDDFQDLSENFGMNIWQGGMTANKNVYVENFEDAYVRNPLFDPGLYDPAVTDGSPADMWARDDLGNRIPGTGRDIFARVQLREFMQLGEGVRAHPFGLVDEERINQDWGIVSAGPFTTFEPGADRTDPTTWAVRTFQRNSPLNSTMADYWQWNFGGDDGNPGYKWFMPTFNRDPYSLESDVKGSAISYRTLGMGEITNRTNPNGANPYNPDAGNLLNYWEPSDVANPITFPIHEELYKYWDDNADAHAMSTAPRMNVAQPTLTSSGVILMADWLNLPLDQQVGNFWVWDTDGWFYWAAPLPAGQATGLLLSDITLRQDTMEEMYYGIFVDSEMATATHWDEYFTSRTLSGQALMERISGNLGAAMDVRAIIADTAVGGTFYYNGDYWRVLARDGTDALIIWDHATTAAFNYNTTNDYTRLGASNLRGHLNGWAGARLTPGLRDIILVPDGVENDVRYDWDDGPQHPAPTSATGPGFTTPGAATTTAAQANESVFILSRSESLWYFDNDADRIVFADADNPGLDILAGITPRGWWLRSPGSTEAAPANIIAASGATSGIAADGVSSIRPAMWVSTAGS